MRSSQKVLILCAAAFLAAACGDNGPTSPGGGVLAGLNLTETNDSTPANTPPDNGTGIVHGTVLGQSQPGLIGDTLATAPRIAGVVVTVYLPGSSSDTPGPQVATLTTGADGTFTLPALSAGNYVVTFVPPSGSGYNGVYVTGHVSSISATYPWWIVLSRK
jgi:hypothetical protein